MQRKIITLFPDKIEFFCFEKKEFPGLKIDVKRETARYSFTIESIN